MHTLWERDKHLVSCVTPPVCTLWPGSLKQWEKVCHKCTGSNNYVNFYNHLTLRSCHNYAVPEFNSLEAANASLVTYTLSSSEVLLATRGYMGGTPFGLLPGNGNEATLQYHCMAINREAKNSIQVSLIPFGTYVNLCTVIY